MPINAIPQQQTHPIFKTVTTPFSVGAFRIYVPNEWLPLASPEQRDILQGASRIETVASCDVYRFSQPLAEALGIR